MRYSASSIFENISRRSKQVAAGISLSAAALFSQAAEPETPPPAPVAAAASAPAPADAPALNLSPMPLETAPAAAPAASAPAVAASAPVAPVVKPAAVPAPVETPTIVKSTTRYSQKIRQMEERANRERPERRIILLDYDQIMLRLAREDILMRFMVIDQLKERGVTTATTMSPADMVRFLEEQKLKEEPTITVSDLYLLRDGIGGKEHFDPSNTDARSVHVNNVNPPICVVLPQSLDRASLTVAQQHVGIYNGLNVKQDFAPEVQFLRASYHEIWHCYDKVFLPAQDAHEATREQDPKTYAWTAHRAEMFAEVAAHLTLAVDGYTDILTQQADIRLLHTEYDTEHFVRLNNPKVDPEYYGGALYHLAPGIEAVKAHVEQVGMDKVKAYTWNDIERIATEITERTAMTRDQFNILMRHFVNKKNGVPDEKSPYLQSYLQRVEEAKARMVTVGQKLKDVDADEIPSDEDFMKAVSPAIKKELIDEFDARVKALKKGVPPEQAFMDMLDDYRAKLHAEKDKAKINEAEQRLVFLRAYVSTGELRTNLRERDQAAVLAERARVEADNARIVRENEAAMEAYREAVRKADAERAAYDKAIKAAAEKAAADKATAEKEAATPPKNDAIQQPDKEKAPAQQSAASFPLRKLG